MKFYLLRHGKADWPEWAGEDDDRPLAEEGVEEMRMVALALKRIKVSPDVILSSSAPKQAGLSELGLLPAPDYFF